jgi:uncharacterized protein involved in type VI secretion and phage assembly
MADSPLLDATGPLGVIIEADGTVLPDDVQIMSVDVVNKVGQIAECRITLVDGNPAEQEFPLTDDAKLKPGTEIKVKAHYGGGTAQEIFSGVIIGLRTRISGGDASCTLDLDCRSKAVKLHQVRTSALYTEKKDSDIISEIANGAGLSPQVTATSATHKQILRSDCTDWEYVRLLAERNGLLVHCDGSDLYAKEPDISAAAVLAITFGTDILEVDLEISAQRAFSGAAMTSWNINDQSTQQADSQAFAGPKWGNLTINTLADVVLTGSPKGPVLATPADLETDLLRTYASAIVQGTELGRIVGTVRFPGSALAKPNTNIELAGLSERMNGAAFVTGVEHRLESGGWVTTAYLGAVPQSEGFGTRRRPVVAAGVTTPIHGLQVGVVKQRHEDPAGLARIMITLPMVAGTEDGIWARLAAPYAGNATGIDFLPETGDEVIVAFLGGDPSNPVILGSVHNPKATGPVEATEDNFLKIIQTRSGIKLTFDDEKKAVTIDTPDGAQVTLDDDAKVVKLKDQNGNEAELGSAGITLSSPKDITLDAKGNVVLKAAQDVTVKGMNVTAEAQVGATVKGNASAEISASGTTTVKGAMVMIN